MERVILLAALAFGAGGGLYGFSLRALAPDLRRERWRKYWVYLLIVSVVVLTWWAGRVGYRLLVGTISLMGAREIHEARLSARASGRDVPARALIAYAPLGVAATIGAATASPDRVLFVFATIATFDGACQVSGQLFGRRKLAPRLSPGKTMEWFVGGLLAAAAVAAWLAVFIPAPAAAMALVALGMGSIELAGDLSASWVKRRAGLKDFNGLIPGHGGVLDRFDAFLPNCALLAIPAIGGIEG